MICICAVFIGSIVDKDKARKEKDKTVIAVQGR